MLKSKKRSSLSVGDKVLGGRYSILRVIHTSGMANVYLASDSKLLKTWCLKEIIKSESGRNEIEYRSLLQDANIMKSLNHSGIPRIVTIEEEGDSLFVVMDYIEGISIKEWIVKRGPVKQSVAVSWIKQVCNVLAYLHNRNNPIFYRDMKPDNIMVQDDGNIKLIDFGISAVITDDNKYIKEALGTKGYAAPEQKKKGLPYDLRSDIYSLGMTFYHMLTGINPGVAEGNLKPLTDIDSSLSKGLQVIIEKCTKENPNDRYQTVEEILYDLSRYIRLDNSYKNALKRKVKISVGLFMISVGLLVTSFIPYKLYEHEIDDMYENKLNVAIQTGRTSDYLEAIAIKPLKLKPYSNLIDSFKIDGVFSKQEEKDLLGIVNPVLSKIKEEDGYGDLAYNIGKLYWFYYEGDDGDVVSNKWFKEASKSGSNKEEAKVFYDLGYFKSSISMKITESSDSGMYIEYWNNLMKAKTVDSGELVELYVYTSIADAISIYTPRLKSDGVLKEDILNEIDNINKFLMVSSPISDKSKGMKDDLIIKVRDLSSKVELVYANGN